MPQWLIQLVNRGKDKWFFSFLALLIALLIFLPPIALSAWNDVTSSVNLNRSRPLYNYVAKVTYFDVTLANISGESFQSPIRLVIDSVTSSEVKVHNADGLTDDGKPYFDLSPLSGDGRLDTGETSAARKLEFYNPNRLRFDFSIKVFVEAKVSADVTPPMVTITAPKDGATLNSSQITVQGMIEDESSIQSAFINGIPLTLDGINFTAQVNLVEGANTITVTATDSYGNVGSDSITVILDTTPPDLTVEPIAHLTNEAEITIRGASEPGAAIALTGGVRPVSGQTDQVSGSFSIPAELYRNTHNILSVSASDKLGNTSQPKILEIDQDSTSPYVVSVAPAAGETVDSQNVSCIFTFSETIMASTVALGASFQITCGGVPLNGGLTLSQGNQVVTFRPDSNLPPGSQVNLLLTSAITDLAGNQMGVPFNSKFFIQQEVRASVVTGEVYNDTKGLLLQGVTAKLLSTNDVLLGDNAPAMVTGNDGLFTLEVSPGKQSILISLDGYTSVERKVEVAANTSATLLDARLTPLDSRLNQISGLIGGHATNAHGDIKVVFAEDSSNSDIGIRITKVSQQGLRSPLPLGWSPVITVDLAANIQRLKHPATLTVPLPSNFRNIGPLTAVRWDNESSAWRAISEPIQIGDIPKIELSIDQLGQFSLMVQDQGTTQPPTAKKGNILEGAAPVAYPAGITGEGVVVPAAIMAGEESHARASASLTLSQALPSGTVFEAKVMETFTLTSNERLISQPFVQDLHFYAWPDDGNPLTLSVEFPVSPSKRFSIGELYMGKVDLFIRQPQATSAHLVGPAGAKITTKEGLDISIPSGCVARNTTLHLIPIPETLFAGHIPTGMTYLGGFSIDLGGVPLSKPIEVTLPPLSDSIILPPEPYIIMARVEEFGDIPSLFLTGLGQIINNRVQSLRASAGLTFSGIDKAGQYGFFLLADPVGFLQGTVYELSGQASTNAVISNASLPFLARVDKVGHHIQIGTVGNVQLLAENPDTSDQGMATALVTGEKEIVNLDISILQTPPRVVSVMPSDGSSGVPVTTTVSVTFSEPVTGINEDTFQLKDTSGNKVAGHLSLTDEGKAVTFYPGVSLSSESAYTLYLGDGIKDKAGYSLPGFSPVTFTTEDLSPPVSQGKLSISMPDKNGYATVTGTPGTAEPNSTVYIINNTSGMVVTISIPSSSVGSFSEKILADISDEIIVTIVDASGNSTTLNPGPFKDETTGAMAIGPKGGIVRGEGGIELDIPAGALPYATVVTVEPVDEPFELPEDIQGDPDLVDAFEENYEFVQAVRIDTGGVKFNYGVLFPGLNRPKIYH